MTTPTTTDMINNYLRYAFDYRYRQALAYVQVLACTSPRVDTDGTIICESIIGSMSIRPDDLYLKMRMFYDRENPYSLREELSILRLADRFGILPPSDRLYIAVTRYGERLSICDNRIYGTSFFITAHGRKACISDTDYPSTCSCNYSMLLSTRTIYRTLAKQLREQVARLV